MDSLLLSRWMPSDSPQARRAEAGQGGKGGGIYGQRSPGSSLEWEDGGEAPHTQLPAPALPEAWLGYSLLLPCLFLASSSPWRHHSLI